jgi:mono/diheme cytochrome c family protein
LANFCGRLKDHTRRPRTDVVGGLNVALDVIGLPAPATADTGHADRLELGARPYQDKCAICHGAVLKGRPD